MRFFTCLTQEHDLSLVALAAALCVVGSIISINLLQRLRQADTAARPAWLFMGAVASGATVWCTHFVAMIAYQPGVAVAYEPVLTALSLGVAILGGALGLSVASGDRPHSLAVGGGILGLTVSAMHYTGMAAFTVQALVHWSWAYVAASLIGAVGLCAVAFNRLPREATRSDLVRAVVGMVCGIVVLHFTGMAALTVTPLAPMDGVLTGAEANTIMAFAVAGVGLLILGTGVSSYALDVQGRARAAAHVEQLLEGSVDGMVVTRGGRIIAANAAFAKLVGGDAAAMVGADLARWIPDLPTLAVGVLSQTSLAPREGPTVPVEVAVRRETDPSLAEPLITYAVRDLRARLAQERRIAHLARNDALTGLPNRASFLEWLTRNTAADGARIALLAIDLDRFKEVNDIHGHAAGDQLLTVVAQRMRDGLRTGEFIARLGGDEFVALAPVKQREDALDLAERLATAIAGAVDLGHAEVTLGSSIGVAVWPEDATDVSTLINNADLAMYRAKGSLVAKICFYEEEMDEAVRKRRRLAQQLREALDEDHFSIHWQVQASVETGAVTGYEALLRWRRPDGAPISPAEFIPLAEATGLILPIGEWVLRQACKEAADWVEPLKVAVNLSPVQLSNVDLPRLVHQVLVDTGLSPSRLELEITETAMISDMQRTTHVLRQLKALGVSIAMDDFGTGYSSLSTLKAFPFDKIKLDQSFMSELDENPQSWAIIRAVLALGEGLRIPVLAEGVETEAQLAFLRAQGCTEAQGFLLGRPGPEATCELSAEARAFWTGAEPPSLARRA